MIDLLNDSLRNCFGHTLVNCGFTVERPLMQVEYGRYNNSYAAVGRSTTSIKVSIKFTFNEVKFLGGSDNIYNILRDIGGLHSMNTNMDPMNGLFFYDLSFVVGDITDFASNLDKLNLAQKIYEATFHEVLEQELKR